MSLQSFRNSTSNQIDAGFTLVELMIVMLILAILMAIAIPTFLGVAGSANDRAAQSNLNTATISAKGLFQSQGQSYFTTAVTTSAQFATTLGTSQAGITFTTGPSTQSSTVSVAVSRDGNAIVLATYSKNTHNCWLVIDNPLTPTPTLNVPWTGAATLSGTTTQGSIVVPSTSQQLYAVVINDMATADCNAGSPAISGSGELYKYQTGSFPT
jgi:type IV pilus assembly protein PilA